MTPLQTAAALYADRQYADAWALAAAEAPLLLNVAGTAAYALGRVDDAERCWEIAVRICPDLADAHANLGMLLTDGGRLDQAEAAYRRALAIQPAHAVALNNLGVLLGRLERAAEAEAVYRRALAARPDYTDAFTNLGVLLATAERLGEAEDCFRQALALRPGDADAHYNLSILLLSLGRFREAWPHYEARYHPEKTKRTALPPVLPLPQWRGEALAGKSLLVWHEQGFGDEIQFCRFLPLLKKRGLARVGVVCKAALAPLLQTLDGIDAVYADASGPSFAAYDYWTLPMSIPLHLGVEAQAIPADIPYLRPLPERLAQWRVRLPEAGLRVGLVWKGFAGHANDGRRSLPGPATLAPLWDVPGVAFVSLQKWAGEEEARQPPPGQPLTHLGSDIIDFADTAAIVAQLDLLICVDTAVAHLAGALGKPCWVLLPAIRADWRWLRGRCGSPWYPHIMRLFRQEKSEPWAVVAGRVAEALAAFAQASAGEIAEKPRGAGL
ncbi:MAG: tetratricopeptide repeat protein [Candidatus Methylumidiphilus sp.]